MRKQRVLQNHTQKYGSFCYYCGTSITIDTMTVEHITPKSLGGSNSISNLSASCRHCNCSKRNSTVEEFRILCSWKTNKYSSLIGWPHAKRLIDAGIDFGEIPEYVFHFEK